MLLLKLASVLMIGQTDADAVRAAHADRVPVEQRPNIRYLRRPPGTTDEQWLKLARVTSGNCNGLSSRGAITRPALGKDLLRIELSRYGWTPEIWERLRPPYEVANVQDVYTRDVQRVFQWEGGIWPGDGKHYPKGAFPYKKWVTEPVGGSKEGPAAAPWMSEGGVKKEMADLVTWHQTIAPIVRADWFFVEIAFRRYYEFQGITNQKDYEKLVRFNAALAEELERKKVVIFSGIAKGRVRRIERTQTTLGGLWRTFDSEKPVGDKSPLVHLDNKLKFEASEWIGTRLNGFPAFFLSNDKGVLQQVAPQNIVGGYRRRGPDHNDSELTINVSCIDCHLSAKHESMLKDIDAASIRRLTSYGDYKLIEDLEREYVNATGPRDIPAKIKEDRDFFAAAIFEATGLSPQEYGAAYLEAYGAYEDRRVDLAVAAADLGMTQKELRQMFEEEAGYVPTGHGAQKYTDDMKVISVLSGGGALPIRAYEDVYQTIQEIKYRHRRKDK